MIISLKHLDPYSLYIYLCARTDGQKFSAGDDPTPWCLFIIDGKKHCFDPTKQTIDSALFNSLFGKFALEEVVRKLRVNIIDSPLTKDNVREDLITENTYDRKRMARADARISIDVSPATTGLFSLAYTEQLRSQLLIRKQK